MRFMKSMFVAFACWFAVAGPGARPAAALPDLVVRTDTLEEQWVVRDETLSPDACSVIEGEVTPGDRRLLRFTVTTANVGDVDISIGDPRAHFAANDGLFELATCHQHFHFRNYARYELIDPATGHVWRAAKRGFCMLDTDPTPPSLLGGEPPRHPNYRSCGTLTVAGNQGITRGWSDTYRFFLGGQFFVLDGGDGQPPVPPGRYVIRITANPTYVPAAGEPCRFQDPSGGCHALEEANYANNVGEVTIDIPAHPGRSGHGPGAGLAQPKGEPAEH